ncbi:hypothetical protein Ocin01_11822 [Orchesella cincta]|uniref:Cuticle protein 6 n=1 Tax=Orchesella cincta TaxID=48709 RepID=A0A1D2MPR6_ORCCI|nr:hypothetical protein Ocin01_11822 [Orchesella cincta]
MGTRILLRLAVGLCIFGAVSAQYPYNSLYHGQEKEQGRYRPQLAPSSTTENPEQNTAKFAKIMKQINKVNDDGSYTFGYEADDGSFRVETRTKDGLVKGKYGFVDANGKLKVTEYTAGEKSEEPERTESGESDEGELRPSPRPGNSRSLPLSARPQPSYQPRQQAYSSQSRPVIAASPVQSYRLATQGSYDQSVAAQTPSKISRAPPTTDDDFREESDESDAFSRRQSQGQGQAPSQGQEGGEDGPNGHYFRAVPVQRAQGGSGAGRFPGGGISAGGRPIPSPYSSGAPPQYQGGFSPYNYPQGAGGPQGFQGQGAPQFGPQYASQGQEYQGFPQAGPGPQGFSSPQGGFRQLQQAPQDFSSIGNPQGAPQRQQIQQFGGLGPAGPGSFGGFNARQGSQGGKGGSSGNRGAGPSADEQYVPSVELDGYSEDLDQDGYPDEPPKDGKLPQKSSSGASPQSYRPQALGPQGGVQPGRGSPGTRLTDEQFQQLFSQSQSPQGGAPGGRGQGPQGIPQGQIILQLGPQGQIQGGPGGAGGRFSVPQQGGGQQGGQGIPPQYLQQQQQFGGFPQGAYPQGVPQGFPQGFEGAQGGAYPQQFAGGIPQSAGGPGQYQDGRFGGSQGSPLQSEGFPYDFNSFGGGQGFPQGAQGFHKELKDFHKELKDSSSQVSPVVFHKGSQVEHKGLQEVDTRVEQEVLSHLFQEVDLEVGLLAKRALHKALPAVVERKGKNLRYFLAIK